LAALCEGTACLIYGVVMAKLKSMEFLLPATLEEALQQKAEAGEGGRFVAGGTDLVLQVGNGRHQPEKLIRLPVDEAEPLLSGDRLRISAFARLRILERHPLLLEHVPILAEAISQIGSPQIRWAGTLGGNLGNASPAADSVPPLLVYDADIEVASVRGRRTVAVADFFTGPGRTVLAPDEAIVAVNVPLTGGRDRSMFRKFGPRGANVISSASFAARVKFVDGKVTEARLAAGSVAPRPVRLPQTEAALQGLRRRDFAQNETIKGLTATLTAEVKPISDVRGSAWYKTQVVDRCLQFLADQLQQD
jgi:CO/xanthine dehydrogenase FAD-binding subunit